MFVRGMSEAERMTVGQLCFLRNRARLGGSYLSDFVLVVVVVKLQ